MRIVPRSIAAILSLALLTTFFGPILVAGSITVTITTPRANEIVAGNVSVKGQASGAASVDVRIDNETSWRNATGSSAWNHTWDSHSYSKGYHNISARAKSGATYSDIVSVRVYINNTPPKAIVIDASATPLELSPGDNVTVSGFINYDTGVALKGIPVTVQVITTMISVTVNTTDTGYFITAVKGPQVANRYTLRVSVTDGHLTAKKEFQLSVMTPTQPDLVLKSLRLDPAQPKHDDTVSLCATIENQGNEAASAIVKFYIDGVFQDQKSVQVDTSATVKDVWVATYGTHTIKAVIDNVNPIDKDLSNNQMSIKVTVQTEPDVHMLSLVLSNPSPRDGDTVSVMVKLENIGYTGATGTVILYDGDPIDGKTIDSKGTMLKSNETVTLYLVWRAVKGQHTLTARVLVDGQALEQQHTITKDVTVLPAKKVNNDTPFVGAGAIIAVFVLVALFRGAARRPGAS